MILKKLNLSVFLVQNLVNVVPPLSDLEENIFVATLLHSFFHLIELFLCRDASYGLVLCHGILLPSNGSAQIHVETTSDMLSHVFNLVLLADGIPQQFQSHLRGWSVEQNVVFCWDPDKGKSIFKQNHLSFDVSMIAETLS